jgi:membrane protein
MTAFIRNTIALLKCLVVAAYNTNIHRGGEQAGNLAFLTLLSLFPFLVFTIALATYVGDQTLGVHFIEALISKMPDNVADTLRPHLENILGKPPQGLLTIAVIGAIWASSALLSALRTVLNRAYRIESPPQYIWRRLLSIFELLLLTGFIILLMLLEAMKPSLSRAAVQLTELDVATFESSIRWFNFGGSFSALFSGLILALLIALTYVVLTNKKIRFRDALPGAVLVAIAWIATVKLLTWYIYHSQQISVLYGGLSGIVMTLFFFYLLNLALIFGAEFNYLQQEKQAA